MLETQRKTVKAQMKKYGGGLNQLKTTNLTVTNLKQDLTMLQPVLEDASANTAQLLQELESDRAQAELTRQNCEKDSIACEEEMQAVQTIKNECQADLDEAIPAFQAAIDALDTLNKDDITEVKGYAKPPKLVAKVMGAVCLLMGEETTW
eukprot:678573_1